MKLSLPDEVLAALGPDPEHEVLEGVLLLLVGEGRLSLERAGGVLGFKNGDEARRWYAARARPQPEEVVEEPVFLENLTQEQLDKMDRFPDIPPAEKGSGLSDVSINHDKYLYGDA